MDFDPTNPIIRRCMQGMSMEDKSMHDDADKLFMQAWNEATNDFEKFIAAYYIGRQQKMPQDKLKWLETSLDLARKINNDTVNATFSNLHTGIAKCYEELNNPEQAKRNLELAAAVSHKLTDKGPFYHGTKADLKVGDHLTAGYNSNYNAEVVMNHIYFTALVNGAGLAADLAGGDKPERVYIVEPTGDFENDPNVTNKKFPGNPTRSYRSQAPLKIVGEIKDWVRQTPEQLQEWRKKLAHVAKAEIIN